MGSRLARLHSFEVLIFAIVAALVALCVAGGAAIGYAPPVAAAGPPKNEYLKSA